MGRYLFLWEVDMHRAPVDPKERGAAWVMLLELVKKDMEAGVTKAWGAFVGEASGFVVIEGSEVEVALTIQKYVPYVRFKGHALETVEQAMEMSKKMAG